MGRENENKSVSRRGVLKIGLYFTVSAAIPAACASETEELPVSVNNETVTATSEVISTQEPPIIPTEIKTEDPVPTSQDMETPSVIPTECPQWSVSEEEKEYLANHEVRLGDKDRKVILMTYDDQGDRARIHQILDAFKKHNGKTTFFFTGTGFGNNGLSHYKEEIKRIVDEGHVFGSHSLVHDPHTLYDETKIRNHFNKWLSMAAEIVPNYRVRYLRFPYGDRSERELKIAAEFGFQSVMWSVESGGTTEETFSYVVDRVKPGSIVLSHMHRYYDVFYADSILSRLTKDGYSLESMETGLSPQDRIPDKFRQSDLCFQDKIRQ